MNAIQGAIPTARRLPLGLRINDALISPSHIRANEPDQGRNRRHHQIEQFDRTISCGRSSVGCRGNMADGRGASRGFVGLVPANGEFPKSKRAAASATQSSVWLHGAGRQHAQHSDAQCLPFWPSGRSHAGVRPVLPGLFCPLASHQHHQEEESLVRRGNKSTIWQPQHWRPDDSSARRQQAGARSYGALARDRAIPSRNTSRNAPEAA